MNRNHAQSSSSLTGGIKRILMCAGLSAALSTNPGVSYAEDLNDILKRVNELYSAKNYAKALEELSWAQKEIEKANSQVTQGFFPAEILGFKGGKIESTNVFGITNVERNYQGGGTAIKVSLIGGSKGQGQNPLGGLAAFGQMAAMMGNQPGVETFRLDGRTASLETQDDSATLTVFVDGGSMIKFEMSGSSDGAKLREFASALKIADIEKHLKG